MKSNMRLALYTAVGVCLCFAFVWGLDLARTWLISRGYAMSPVLYAGVLCGGLGAIYGGVAQVVLRQVARNGRKAGKQE